MLIYAAAVAFGHAFGIEGSSAILWPAGGLLLAALLVRPRKEWLWIALLSSSAQLLLYMAMAGVSTGLMYSPYCLIPAAEALIAAAVLRWLFPEGIDLSQLNHILALTGVGALLAPTLGAFVGPNLVAAASGEYWSVWQVWWAGNALGVLAVAPVSVFYAGDLSNRRRDWPELRPEALLILAVIIATSLSVFGSPTGPAKSVLDFPYLVFPPMIWAALRLEQRLVGLSGLAIAFLAVIFTHRGLGPFIDVGQGNQAQVLALQSFLAVTLLSAWILSAVVSERRRADARRTAAEGQFEQSQKMEAIGQLAGGIAHDFNNLLMVIQGNLDLAGSRLHASTGEDDPAVTSLNEAALATERAAALTRQLLVFSRRKTLSRERFEMNQLIDELEPMLRRLIGEHIDLAVNAGREPLPIAADRSQMEQVVLNLVVNARDAMSGGGRLDIELEKVPADKNSSPGVLSRDHVLLSVSDTGSGISQEALPHVFEPFFTTKSADKGTGLGLSTVHGVVSGSEGSVEVESVPDEGSTFRIRLPLTSGRESNAPLRQTRPEAGNETILVCEDEASIRPLLKRALEDGGYRVLLAEDPRDAIELASNESEINLLLTDVVMPGMNGFELAARVRESCPDLPALYISGYPSDELASHREVDVSLIMPKPFKAAALRTWVRQALDEPRA